MLEAVGNYNNFSKELRDTLEKKKSEVGRRVKYKFNISRQNPDPEQYNGPVVWPGMWYLPRATFEIVDPGNKKRTKVGMVMEYDDKNVPTKFNHILLIHNMKGILELDLEKPDDQDMFAFLELHPYHSNGMFMDKDHAGIFHRIDEVKEARNSRAGRSLRADALVVARDFSTQEVRDFASSMGWDEYEEEELLRDKLEDLADNQPSLFTEWFNTVNFKIRALVKRAFDKNIIIFIPVENKVIWGSTQSTIAILDRIEGSDKNEVVRFAEWLEFNPKQGDEIVKRLNAQIK